MLFQIATNLQKVFQYINLKNLHIKRTHIIQTHVVQGSTVILFAFLLVHLDAELTPFFLIPI